MRGSGFFEDNAIVRVARKWQGSPPKGVENACNARREATRVDPWIARRVIEIRLDGSD
jgi:hypothetical protein